jgi:hypothetical protein
VSGENGDLRPVGGYVPAGNKKKIAVGRYWLFAGHKYRPQGGFIDFRQSFASVKEAVEEVSAMAMLYGEGWWHIVDVEKQKVVEDGVFG